MARAIGVAWLAYRWIPAPYIPWVGFALILGNRFPLFHGFRGGKGVANYLGFSAYISPVAALFAIGAWAAAWRLTGHPFIGSFVLILILGVQTVVVVGCHPIAVAGSTLTVGFIAFCHRANILSTWKTAQL